jgi:bifunctional polynucleotide phosphatase/kinase
MEWEKRDTCLIGKYQNFDYNRKHCACFDLDDTLIITKSGKKFATNNKDWKFLFDNIPNKLNELNKKYNLIVFTNQAGLKNEYKENDWKEKIENICDALELPIQVFVALRNDFYRKPVPAMWEEFVPEHAKGEKSFFVGDACGRKNDFSDTDLKFALNCKMKFYTPEEFFQNKKQKIPEIKYVTFQQNQNNDVFEPKTKEIIIMVGMPGSGKSTFVKTYILPHHYVHINRDVLKTATKCINETKKCLNKKLSVVIDNTNPSKLDRQKYLEIAKEFNYHTRCIIIKSNKELAQHNTIYRNYINHGTIDRIPNLVYNMYNKKYEVPTKDEGFDDVIEIEPNIQNTDEMYRMYMM